MLIKAVPHLLRLAHQRGKNRHDLRVGPYQLDGQIMDTPLGLVDQLRAISRLPDTGDQIIVLP